MWEVTVANSFFGMTQMAILGHALKSMDNRLLMKTERVGQRYSLISRVSRIQAMVISL